MLSSVKRHPPTVARVVVQERQEGVPLPSRHRRGFVLQRAGEYHRPARRRDVESPPDSGNRRHPPSYSPVFRFSDTANRRCAVPLVVLSRWGLKKPPLVASSSDGRGLAPRANPVHHQFELIGNRHPLGSTRCGPRPIDRGLGWRVRHAATRRSGCGRYYCGINDSHEPAAQARAVPCLRCGLVMRNFRAAVILSASLSRSRPSLARAWPCGAGGGEEPQPAHDPGDQ